MTQNALKNKLKNEYQKFKQLPLKIKIYSKIILRAVKIVRNRIKEIFIFHWKRYRRRKLVEIF